MCHKTKVCESVSVCEELYLSLGSSTTFLNFTPDDITLTVDLINRRSGFM